MTTGTVSPISRIRVTERARWLVERQTAVTASDVGALFGVHSHKSKLSLFLEKTGQEAGVKEIDPKIARRGRVLESAVAEAVREDRTTWEVTKATDYLFQATQKILLRGAPTDVGIGATPDYIVQCPARGRGVLQIKTAIPKVFERDWTAETPPLWIILQVQQEMMMEQVSWAALAVQVLDPWTWPTYIYEFDAHPGVQDELRRAISKFWSDVESGRKPDVTPKLDSDLLKALHPGENGQIVDMRHHNELPSLIGTYLELKEKIKAKAALEKELKSIETAIRGIVGDNLGALTADFEVMLPVVTRKAFQVEATSYRQLKIRPIGK